MAEHIKTDMATVGFENMMGVKQMNTERDARIMKYRLADHMRNSMHIPDEFLQFLDKYKIIHWTVPTFKDKLIDGTLTIGYPPLTDITIYNVIYYNTTPAAAKSAKEIRLSFRKAKPEFNIEPYVLVQIVEH